jgi:ribosomal protein L15E
MLQQRLQNSAQEPGYNRFCDAQSQHRQARRLTKVCRNHPLLPGRNKPPSKANQEYLNKEASTRSNYYGA